MGTFCLDETTPPDLHSCCFYIITQCIKKNNLSSCEWMFNKSALFNYSSLVEAPCTLHSLMFSCHMFTLSNSYKTTLHDFFYAEWLSLRHATHFMP